MRDCSNTYACVERGLRCRRAAETVLRPARRSNKAVALPRRALCAPKPVVSTPDSSSICFVSWTNLRTPISLRRLDVAVRVSYCQAPNSGRQCTGNPSR